MRTAVKVASTAVALLWLAACASPPAPPPLPPVPVVRAPVGWIALKDFSEASGHFSCAIRRVVEPLFVFLPSRRLTAITEDQLYPGSFVYLSIDGQRFSGKEGIWLDDESLAALRRGRVAHIAWSPWPWGGQREKAVSLEVFSAAYDECAAWVAEMRQAHRPDDELVARRLEREHQEVLAIIRKWDEAGERDR